MHACMHACKYVSMYVCMYLCMYFCNYFSMPDQLAFICIFVFKTQPHLRSNSSVSFSYTTLVLKHREQRPTRKPLVECLNP